VPRQLLSIQGRKKTTKHLLIPFRMISKAKVKYIKSLQVKKYRLQEQCFVLEGAKSITELLQSDFEVVWLAGTETFLLQNEKWIKRSGAEVLPATEAELSNIGTFQSNDAAVAIARMKPNRPPSLRPNETALVLDDIRDPGNLGAIIRLADWFGLEHMVASEETVDLYNPKALSASMGSFCRVSIFYTPLASYLNKAEHIIYGAFLNGTDVHRIDFRKGGWIIIGNEAKGISAEIEKLVKVRITIPRYGRAESLNAAMATGIILDAVKQSQK
jgi:TrmH family RNA methyltransferase